MAKNPFRQLRVIRNASANGKQIFDCYRLMYKKELWIKAFHELYGNQPISSDHLHMIDDAIAKIKASTFRFHRKSKMCDVKLELALQVLTKILQNVFIPHLNDNCYQSYRKALLHIKNTWQTVTWCIEEDLQPFISQTKHAILLKYISQKICDHRFLLLLHNALRNGMINSRRNSKAQSNFSTMITNIYLHKIDHFMEKIIKNLTNDVVNRNDFHFGTNDDNLKYVRYKTTFLLGIQGSKKFAKEVKTNVKQFLVNELNMKANDELTLNHFSKRIFFLGYHISRQRSKSKHNESTFNYFIRLEIPKMKIQQFARHNNYGDIDRLQATHRSKLIHFCERDIIAIYERELQQFATYYKFATNFNQMKKLVQLAKRSCIKTIALKRKKSYKKIALKYNELFVSWNDLK